MDVDRNHRLLYSICLFYACAVIVSTGALERPGDKCVPEMCTSAPVISERCLAQCERWTRLAHKVDAEPDHAGSFDQTESFDHSGSFDQAGSFDHAGTFIRVVPSDLAKKRYSSFVRIGRPAAVGGKRYSSFVRIGRAGVPQELEEAQRHRVEDLLANKRGYSSFVRIGRNAQ